MKKFTEKVRAFFKKYLKEITCVALFLLGVLFLIVGTNDFVRALSFACWAGCVFIMRVISRQKGADAINTFDKEAEEILKDIEINGEASEYYRVVDINIITKERVKLVKKINRQSVTFSILAGVLAIISILCVI